MTTWLLVEDEPDLHEVLLALCNLWQIDGIAFKNGETVLDWIERVEAGDFDDYLPKLALLDIRLPNASGLDISARLRQSKRLKDMAIVLMTAYHLSPEDERAALEKSVADLLMYKPLPSVIELRNILDGVLAHGV